MRLLGAALGILAWAAAAAAAEPRERPADWPTWRGPARTGVAADGPKLADSWPEGGPPRLWQSEPIPGGGGGGYASPVVAGGRVYLYVNWKRAVPIPTRTLSEGALKGLGWRPESLPPEVAETVEKARLSEEREKLSGDELKAWIDAWPAKHLAADQAEKSAEAVKDRLRRGKSALPLDVLERLATIRGKPFEGPEALEGWLAANAIADDTRDAVLKVIPTAVDEADDVVVCLNAADGRTLWKATFPGRPHGNGASGTPCVAAGRLYATGSDGTVYCLDAKTGEKIWATQVGKGCVHPSPALADGMVVVMIGRLVALDAAGGSILWEQPAVKADNNSPVAWRSGGRTFVICQTGKELVCVEAKDGAVAWRVPSGGGETTAAVAGGYAVVQTNDKEVGLIGYRISPDGAERLWNVPVAVRGSSPILAGRHAYALAEKQAVCVELESGKVLWEADAPSDAYASPLLADGKIIANAGRTALLASAEPSAFKILAQAPLGALGCASPAVADGRLYLRQGSNVACFDLRAERPPASEAPASTHPPSD